MQLCQGALLFTSWDAFWVATSAWTCSIQSSMSACIPGYTNDSEATACLLHFSVRWKLLQEQRDGACQSQQWSEEHQWKRTAQCFNDMRPPPIDGSSLPPLSTLCQAAQMVPIHLDIFLGSSIQADSPENILLDNWIEVSTSIQPDEYWATGDSVIQGRPLTYTCSAPGFQSLGQSLRKKWRLFYHRTREVHLFNKSDKNVAC